MLCRDAPVWHTATLAVRRIRIRITMKEIGNNTERDIHFVTALQKLREKILKNLVENTWKVLRGHPNALKSTEWLVG